MKKLSTLLIIALSAICLFGCHKHTYSNEWSKSATEHWHAATCHVDEKKDVGAHVWVKSEKLDADGNFIYLCSVCSAEHQHVYDGEKWEYNDREHWHPVYCGHDDAPLIKAEHSFDDESGICLECGFDSSKRQGYEVAFAYWVVDENGNPVVDSETGSYIQVGVTYTSVEKEGSLPIDTVNGGTLYNGDKISFTVKKSIFCYYTDGASAPLVETISGTKDGEKTVDTIYPDDDGVYTVEIKGDVIITVGNVATTESTITGKGTQEKPFIINSEVDWLYFARYVNDKSYYSINYNVGYWQLNADLDFEGESIYVIGDGYSSQNSVFCGNFDGQGHKISNFVLENSVASTVGEGYSNYLGLFGVVTGYVGVDSVIANLTVENVTVNATANNNDIVAAGCILGYGVGANVINCSVINGEINVAADDLYMSYAGGIVGYLQSGMTNDGMLFYSSVSYSVAENITINGTGMLYCAGGIVGRVVSYNDQVTSFIINCYAHGSVSDAVRAGGIAGELQRYGSIQNCYSTVSVSAHASYKSAVDAKFDGTAYDDRYAYAGGIVGYAENDTVLEGCFYNGSTYATALAGAKYAKKGNIVAGYSAAKFADYKANELVVVNCVGGMTVTNEYLKTELGWNEADWTFGDGYPTINQDEVSHNFTVKINIDGSDLHSVSIDSQYIPLSYWYLIDGSGSEMQAIKRYYQDGANRTFGYYFDSALKQPVPVGYVPMKDMTLYAGYANVASVSGNYYLTYNGVLITLCIKDDGSYTYQDGAVLLNGTYKFDGETLTFDNSFFSRIAPTATATQKQNYYTFWAKLQENGDLHIFDCDEIYSVTAEEENQNPNFTAMARFFTETDPLVAVSQNNIAFTGGYYYTDANSKHVFEFNNDYTGIYKKHSGSTVTEGTFTFEVGQNGDLIISLDKNGARFIANVIEMKIADNRGDSFELLQIDEFAGVWEKEATSHKLYTFDGMGNWSYEHYVYLVNENWVNATKTTVSSSSGEYQIENGKLTLTRSENGEDIYVVASISNGVIFITENGKPVQVEFTAENGYKGVWYTASNKIIRYTLTLEGLNGQGVGKATLGGFEIEPLKLLYTAVANDTLYLYLEDRVYAILQYSPKSGLFEGMFYDTATNSTTTPQTLYLYDDFFGSWVSDVDAIENLKFNGFGDYNTSDVSGDSLAVRGRVTIGTDGVYYSLDRATGNAEFTYNGVKYILSYDEYSNVITVKYGDKVGTVARADEYADKVLLNGEISFVFDGRGNFEGGGTVISNGVSGTYKIQENSNILLQFSGQEDQIITVEKEDGKVVGYNLNGQTLSVGNPFTGVWAIPQKNISLSIENIYSIPEIGDQVETSGTFNGERVTMYYNGVDTITFTTANGKEYSIVNTLGGKVSALILRETVKVGNNNVDTDSIIVLKDDIFGKWTSVKNAENTLTFDGCGNSPYVFGGQAEFAGDKSYVYTYKFVGGVVTITNPSTQKVYATFVECNATDLGAYKNGERYYRLIIA